ncbi:hypothetical protein [Bacillus sp. SG-1]|uniref:hypothetical protein n=1 Tax=Bacillus sp. SG-1 TaxID=161544 RepID=UPI0001543681|nr:hypothetical protein [Bacillus sp. SG-1]EDL65840.1 hypothetical protein BSG1_16330 [Bacillus sp. SG-1]
MDKSIVGVYSSVPQLISDVKERKIKTVDISSIHFYTVEPKQYRIMNENTSLEGSLLDISASNDDSGIHSLATAFDEDDGSIQLVQLEKKLRDEGFSHRDALECKTYLHKGMIVVTEKV